MSWGIKISLVYTGFVILIVSMVFISANNKSELVAKDYYMQELNYQRRIDAVANEKGLRETIIHRIEKENVVFVFPKADADKKIEGEIYFFRPSDALKDMKIKLAPDTNGIQRVPRSLLSKGLYKMCVSWRCNGIDYYKEEVITI